MTAEKSREAPQFEVLLKVKQASNVDFQFLEINHEFHPFYQWLKQGQNCTDEKVSDQIAKAEQQPSAGETNDSMGLLAMYDSSSSEEETVNNNSEKVNDLTEVVTPVEISSGSCAENKTETEEKPCRSLTMIEEQRAQRLKRAKMLRHHFTNR